MTSDNETKLPGNFVSSGTEHAPGVTKLPGSFVTLHVLDTAGLRGREETLRQLVAPHFAMDSKSATFRLEKLGAGLLLREVLGITRDDQLRVGEHGKLFLAGGGPAFNISDDNGLVVLGVANFDAEVWPRQNLAPRAASKSEGTAKKELGSITELTPSIGIDVNEVPDALNRPKLSVARKYFSPAEVKAVGTGETYEERVAFARAWGGIEAPLKAMGTGFTFDFMHHREVLEAWPVTSVEIELASQNAEAAPRHFIAVVAAPIKPQVSVVVHVGQEFYEN